MPVHENEVMQRAAFIARQKACVPSGPVGAWLVDQLDYRANHGRRKQRTFAVAPKRFESGGGGGAHVRRRNFLLCPMG